MATCYCDFRCLPESCSQNCFYIRATKNKVDWKPFSSLGSKSPHVICQYVWCRL